MSANTVFYALLGICFLASGLVNVVNGTMCPTYGTFTFEDTTPRNFSCTQLDAVPQILPAIIQWSDGRNSSLVFGVVTSVNANGILTDVLNGNINQGVYAGLTILITSTYPSITAQCLTSEGVTQISGTNVAIVANVLPNTYSGSSTLSYSPGITNNVREIELSRINVLTELIFLQPNSC